MTTEDVPDLRILATELLSIAAARWPNLVVPSDITRVKDADNVLLVLLRVNAAILKRAGVPDAEIDKAAARSKRRPELGPGEATGDMFDATPVVALGNGDAGRETAWETMLAVDLMLADPKRRGKVPDWFVKQFWPGMVRRSAQGVAPTERELEVSKNLVSRSKEER